MKLNNVINSIWYCRLQLDFYNKLIEITNMCYEKKYKSALEKADNYFQCGIETDEMISSKVLFNIFPELRVKYVKQNKNNVKKEIIHYFKETIKMGYVTKPDDETLKMYIEFLNDIPDIKSSENKDKTNFKVGDWVVKDKTIAKILSIEKQYYIGIDINGKDFVSSRFLSNRKIHLWTINDAKDGDILVSNRDPFYKNYKEVNNFVCIFKRCINSKRIESHCCLTTTGAFLANTNEHDNINLHPANDVDCKLIFHKMEEKGYYWDDENKMLVNKLFTNKN